MDQIKENFLNTDLQPQVFSLLLLTIVLTILAVVVYVKVKKQSFQQAPKGVALVAEQYVMGIDNLYNEATNNSLRKPAPYIFTLVTFLVFSNVMGLVGIDPPTTSYSVTLTLALVSWIGIYVVGITYQKFRFFKKYLNPVEVLSQFSPLISLSFRLWGNLISGSAIVYISYYFFGWVSQFVIPVLEVPNLLGSIIMAPFHLYFDLFESLIQAYVFSLLTTIYWSVEQETSGETDKTSRQVASKPNRVSI